MMRLVGFNVITQPGPEAYPDLVTVEGINTSFMLGFPAGGIKRNAPFYLANDEYAAFVKFTDAGRFVVVGGDQRIIATGVFDAVTCTLGFISSLFVDTYLTIVYIFSGTMRPLTGIFSILLEILYTVFRIIFNCLPLLIPD